MDSDNDIVYGPEDRPVDIINYKECAKIFEYSDGAAGEYYKAIMEDRYNASFYQFMLDNILRKNIDDV